MNFIYGRHKYGRYKFAQPIIFAGGSSGGGEYTYLPDLYTVIAYAADGTKTAIFGAGAEENTIKKLTFEITETGCGAFDITFSKLPTNAELDYRQRIDIFLFNDNRPWYSGYVLTRPIEGTTETEYKFSGHGYYNLLEKIMIFGTWTNVEVSSIVREIAQTAETKAGLVYNANKVINASYTIDTITFDGVTAKDALAELSDFAIDYVYGVDERRSLYFKPRNTEINEEARFWVGKHVGGYVPSWDVEKIVNWAKIKGATVDTNGEQWLATVEDTTSQTAYGIQEAVWTLPSAYTADDATRWGQNQINKYKDPIKSAKLTKINLEYPKANGQFSVRKLTTDGMAAVYPLQGDLQTYPITRLKYTISADKGIQCEAQVGEQPTKIDKYFAELDRKAKNAEMLQAASTKQLAT